jgi:hypothetical protein
LTWAVCGFLWVFAPLDIFLSARLYPEKEVPFSPLSTAKYVLTFALECAELVLLYFISFEDKADDKYYTADFVSSVVKIGSFV